MKIRQLHQRLDEKQQSDGIQLSTIFTDGLPLWVLSSSMYSLSLNLHR